MTDNRNDAKSAFERAMKPKASPKPAEATNEEGNLSKYSVFLDTNIDRLTLIVKQKLGKAVKKSDILRVLVNLAVDDPTLCNQLVEELKSRQ